MAASGVDALFRTLVASAGMKASRLLPTEWTPARGPLSDGATTTRQARADGRCGPDAGLPSGDAAGRESRFMTPPRRKAGGKAGADRKGLSLAAAVRSLKLDSSRDGTVLHLLARFDYGNGAARRPACLDANREAGRATRDPILDTVAKVLKTKSGMRNSAHGNAEGEGAVLRAARRADERDFGAGAEHVSRRSHGMRRTARAVRTTWRHLRNERAAMHRVPFMWIQGGSGSVPRH